MDLTILRKVAEELIPFNRFLGLRVLALEPGRVEMEIPFREELVGDPVKPALHGGLIATLADTAGGIAIWGALDNPAARVSTVDIRIDYLRPGRLEPLLAEAVAVRVGRTVAVADIRVYHAETREAPVATGKGVYSIKVPRSPSVKQ